MQNVQNCNNYEGAYENDKKNGYGVFNWESGNVYKGNYKDDERDGYGEMFWTDGHRYQGDWVKGIQHGKGKMISPDGSVKEGLFDNNTYIGPEGGMKDREENSPDPMSNNPSNRVSASRINQIRSKMI